MNQAIYQQAIRNGCTPRMAEMLASRQAPRLDTDKVFFSRMGGLEELPEGYREHVIEDARAHGYAPSPGDTYLPGLADFRGDPKAFVSRATGAKRKLKEHIDRCKAGPLEDPLGKPTLAEDIISERMQDMAAEDPGLLERRSVNDVREEIISKHGPQI
jgi:hypothetical protein